MGGKQVTSEDILRARQQGATDKEIHDTVLIAAAFCMYDRYVDGLATWAPTDADLYRENGRRLADEGYVQSTTHLPTHRKSVPSPHRNAARRPERRTNQHRTQFSVRGL
jgi:hypothetical protein